MEKLVAIIHQEFWEEPDGAELEIAGPFFSWETATSFAEDQIVSMRAYAIEIISENGLNCKLFDETSFDFLEY